MSKTLYLECTFGISGDMFVGSLLDLGADEKKLEQALASLPVKGFHTCISRVKKSGLDACDFAVLLDEQHENHDHDMEYLHGAYTQEHRNETKEQTQEAGHAYKHEHRNLKQICEIIEAADMSENAKQIAERIFTVLAEAEAKVHGESMEQVHFHEVGAVDSIVDIVAAAVCLDSLQIEEVIVPILSEGQGTVCCQHGILLGQVHIRNPAPLIRVSIIHQNFFCLLCFCHIDFSADYYRSTIDIRSSKRTHGSDVLKEIVLREILLPEHLLSVLF